VSQGNPDKKGAQWKPWEGENAKKGNPSIKRNIGANLLSGRGESSLPWQEEEH
jgi:hypothetical protein